MVRCNPSGNREEETKIPVVVQGRMPAKQQKVPSTPDLTPMLLPAEPKPLTSCWAQVVEDGKPKETVSVNSSLQKTGSKSNIKEGGYVTRGGEASP